MHVFLPAEDSDQELRSELLASFPAARLHTTGKGLRRLDFPILHQKALPCLAFARQLVPFATRVSAISIRSWAGLIFSEIVASVPDGAPWVLHVEPHYGKSGGHRIGARAFHTLKLRHDANAQTSSRDPKEIDRGAGRHRCELVREALLEMLRQKRRHLLRQLRSAPAPFSPADTLVQVVLTSPEEGLLSIAPAPLPWQQRHLISTFPLGRFDVPADKAAPSRAFAKLVEAEARLGQKIEPRQTCVDLGAAPGSWTYIAVNRNARVTAIDRSPLRDDLMRSQSVQFVTGDAFGFKPPSPVDWLLCDVIAPPERTTELLLKWLRHGWCRRFVVTLKLKDEAAVSSLAQLKHQLPPLTSELFLTRLCANKKEVCAFGVANPR